MKNKKLIAKRLALALAFLPLIVTIIVLPILPDIIPTHFGITGKADDWGSKYTVFLVSLPALISLICIITDKIGEKNENYTHREEKLLLVITYCFGILGNIFAYRYLYAAYTNADRLYNINFNLVKVILIISSILLVIIGAILPKCKQNSLIGIRVSWTMKNKNIWDKTHRFARYLLCPFGIIFIIISFVFPVDITHLILFAEISAVIIVIIIIYSYVIYKKETKEINK